MRTSRKTDLRSSKNNFRGHDISQGLDRQPLSLSPHFLLILSFFCCCMSMVPESSVFSTDLFCIQNAFGNREFLISSNVIQVWSNVK